MHRPVEILLVEDSPADARLAYEALMEGPVPKRITMVTDGAQALDYVHRRGKYIKAPRPDLILLDLNLPKRDGIEVLREVKSDLTLRAITVIVLTTSQFSKDITTAYELSANCYIVKPVDLDHFYNVMHGIEEFWMTLASLPTLGKDPMYFPSKAEGAAASSTDDKAGASTSDIAGRSMRTARRVRVRPPVYRDRINGSARRRGARS